ncbi:MAG TPA: peroxiredoxin [Phycisphaerales bacterium]|nr:peroxiredoxin [Phycisphaerales bacterium]
MLAVGSIAPDFTLRDHAGNVHTLSQYRGKRVVLYFYPKDDTPDCTMQACEFRDKLPHFAGLDAVVLGVSADNERSHQKFANKFQLNFPLLVDDRVDGTPAMISAYGAWVSKSMFGKPYMGVSRTTYLIDAQGRVERVWQKVNPVYNPVEVLHAIRGLPAQEIEAKTPPMFIIEEDEPNPVKRKKRVVKKRGKRTTKRGKKRAVARGVKTAKKRATPKRGASGAKGRAKPMRKKQGKKTPRRGRGGK